MPFGFVRQVAELPRVIPQVIQLRIPFEDVPYQLVVRVNHGLKSIVGIPVVCFQGWKVRVLHALSAV